MTNEEYHAHPAIGNSGLTAIARSPAHYYAQFLAPDRQPREPTPDMEFGTAVHCAVLEPQRFESEYIAAPKFDRRTKQGKQDAEAFEAANAGRLFLPQDQLDACRRVRDSVHGNPAVSVLLASGEAERSIFWTDDDTGVQCKCRPDWLTGDGRVIVDVKTTQDARQAGFARSVFQYRYFVQAAWYLNGVSVATADRPEVFVFVAVEKQPPYAVALYFADPDMIAAGKREYRRNLTTYAECLRTDQWPAYPEQILPLSLPSWALKAEHFEVN